MLHSCMAGTRASDHAEEETPSAETLTPGAEPPIRSNTLFEGRNTLVIEHEGAHYVLRATRSGKLILTK